MPWRKERNQHSPVQLAFTMLLMLILLTAQVSRVVCGWVLQGPKHGRVVLTSATGQVITSNLAQTIRESWTPCQTLFLPANTHHCLKNCSNCTHPGPTTTQDAPRVLKPRRPGRKPRHKHLSALSKELVRHSLQVAQDRHDSRGNRHVQLSTLFSVVPWMFKPWTDPGGPILQSSSTLSEPTKPKLYHRGWGSQPAPLATGLLGQATHTLPMQQIQLRQASSALDPDSPTEPMATSGPSLTGPTLTDYTTEEGLS